MPEKKKTPKNHIVVFQDEDGNVLKTAFVPHGRGAAPPDVPEKKECGAHEELVFTGWTPAPERVMENLVVRARYEKRPKNYLVMYFHEDGKLLGMETVPYGSPAVARPVPEKESEEAYDYIFEGWNCGLEVIRGDTNARAVFRKVKKVFPVTFYRGDGTVLVRQEIPYGEDARPPENVSKAADERYHYVFEGWSEDTSHIVEPVRVHALFRAVWNEYRLRFFDGEELVLETDRHYGDAVPYPPLRKKGYLLSWSGDAETVTEDAEFFASWEFAAPKGKAFCEGGNVFRILNPSVTAGTVCCEAYVDRGSCVRLPAEVTLGDYRYRVTELAPGALAGCPNLRRLILPDSLQKIGPRGLAGCRRLETVCAGKGLVSIGEAAFARDPCLRVLSCSGKNLRRLHKNAFGKLERPLDVRVLPEWIGHYQAVFSRCGIRGISLMPARAAAGR